MNTNFIHETAIVEEGAKLGKGIKIWHHCHIRKGASIGDGVSLGKNVYIDNSVRIGNGSRVQNNVSVYNGVMVGNWVFIGPSVVFTNDQRPRAGLKNWDIIKTKIEDGCSIGAGAIIMPGIILGRFSLIAAGAVVTKTTSPFSLNRGIPASFQGNVCACAKTVTEKAEVVLDCCRDRLITDVLELINQ